MNAPSLTELKTSATSRLTDEKMDQIRDLLFGEFVRESEHRIAFMEGRVRELELSLHRRLDALQARLDAISARTDASQRQAMDEVARGMVELGERIKQIHADDERK